MYYIHVNRNIIDSNRKNGTNEPPITIRKSKYGKSWAAMGVRVPDGSSIRYDPTGRILPCGARLVIECPTEPEIIE